MLQLAELSGDTEESGGAVTASSGHPPDFDLGAFRVELLQALRRVLLGAAERMVRAQTESVFISNEDQKTTLALVRMMPQLIGQLDTDAKAGSQSDTKSAESTDPKAASSTAPSVPHCPECFLCQAPPGSHWAHECPRGNPELREQTVFDYRTQGIFQRKYLGEPAPRRLVPIDRAVGEWLEHNRISRQQYAASIDARKLFEQAEHAAESAQSAFALVEDSEDRKDINAKVATRITRDVTRDLLKILKQIDLFDLPKRTSSKPTPEVSENASDTT